MDRPQKQTKTNQWRSWLFFPALAFGILIWVVLVQNKAQPVKQSLAEQVRAVRVIEIPSVDELPTYIGTGTITPSQIWSGVAEVSGTIVELSGKLHRGEIIQAGELLLRIDPRDYQLKVAQAETAIESLKAQIAEIGVREKNSHASLKIEQKNLKITQAELARKEKLLASGVVTHSSFEKEQRSVLAQTQSVQSLNNALDLLPAERTRMQAELKRLAAQLADTQLDLERTVMRMPFAGRVAETRIELHQYVRQGEALVSVDSINMAEVTVQLQPQSVANLVHSKKILSLAGTEPIKIGEALGVSAKVSFVFAGNQLTWPARVARVSDRMDPTTRTVGLIVEIDDPYKDVRPGVRPPLVKGTFVTVTLTGEQRLGSLVIPPSALHGEYLYVVDAQNRLKKLPVKTGARSGQYMVIESGVSAGQKIIVSDVVPAIEGMLLKPINDTVTLRRLISAATGNQQAEL
ncbi:MAG: efflux RND transporter periplasmic adaptor subunit [Pseudomonadales bacterium]|nr:efflux RND transporter periplasmic adaptor subunit [Pseudomonadales bacterium]